MAAASVENAGMSGDFKIVRELVETSGIFL